MGPLCTPARLYADHRRETFVLSLILDFSAKDSRHTFLISLPVSADDTDDSMFVCMGRTMNRRIAMLMIRLCAIARWCSTHVTTVCRQVARV